MKDSVHDLKKKDLEEHVHYVSIWKFIVYSGPESIKRLKINKGTCKSQTMRAL